MLYQFNPSWGPEVNYYINFVLYAVSGKMGGADNIMELYGDAVRRVAAKLHRLKPITIKEVYRGLLIEPEGLGPGNTISRDPNNTFASFSEDKRVACWFADPNSAMSQFVRMTRPGVEGWVVSTTPKKNDILFHWTWGLKFPFGSGEVGFDHFLRMHPEFRMLSSIETTMRSQQEVILRPTDEVFTATAFKDAGCPTTRELDVLFSAHDPRSRRNPQYRRNADVDHRKIERQINAGDVTAIGAYASSLRRIGKLSGDFDATHLFKVISENHPNDWPIMLKKYLGLSARDQDYVRRIYIPIPRIRQWPALAGSKIKIPYHSIDYLPGDAVLVGKRLLAPAIIVGPGQQPPYYYVEYLPSDDYRPNTTHWGEFDIQPINPLLY